MAPIEKIILYVVSIVVLVTLTYFFYLQEEGGFQGLKKTVESVEYFVPNISIGARELAGEEITLPEEHKSKILKLKETIEKMAQSPKRNCFANYGGFPNLGEEGTIIIMNYEPEKDETLFTIKMAGGKLIPSDLLPFSLPGMRPCVIAGNDELAENFFSKIIETESISRPYYNFADTIVLRYDTGGAFGGITCTNGNRILVPEYGKRGPNYYCNNLQDYGWIFTPDNQHICFLPTNAGKNADEHGIDRDYVASFANQRYTKC